MNYEIEYHDYDVVVVGAGGSGLRATVGAVENGLQDCMYVKSISNQIPYCRGPGRHNMCNSKC